MTVLLFAEKRVIIKLLETMIILIEEVTDIVLISKFEISVLIIDELQNILDQQT